MEYRSNCINIKCYMYSTFIELILTLFYINCILFLSPQMNNSIFKSCKLWWYLIKSWGYPPDKETVFTHGLFIFCKVIRLSATLYIIFFKWLRLFLNLLFS